MLGFLRQPNLRAALFAFAFFAAMLMPDTQREGRLGA